MKFRTVRMEFDGPLAAGGLETSPLPADTLFGALCHGLRVVHSLDRLKALLSGFRESNPPFLISSAFPFAGERFFFPKPVMPVVRDDQSEELSENVRKLVDAIYVDQEIYETILRGHADEFFNNRKVYSTEDGSAVSVEQIPEYIYRPRERPRVTLDRRKRQSAVYHRICMEFHRRTGLYFMVVERDEDVFSDLLAALQFLETEGVGGDRSSGYGQFTLQAWEERSLCVPQRAGWFTTLAPYYPRREELREFDGYYHLKSRGGWVFSPQEKSLKKRRVRVFTEGSVFKDEGQTGELVDVTPRVMSEHRVYRYGLAFPVPLVVNAS